MRVAVLGAGLQGASVALELARHGIAVYLYDKNEDCLTQASAQNEGKIHLGYIYANDRTLNTARAMIRGARAFAPLLRRWIGAPLDAVPISAPFCYAVHAESLLTVDEVEAHFRACHAIALAESEGQAPDYFGSDYCVPPRRLSEKACDALFDRRTVRAAYQTSEMGLDPEALAAAVRTRLAADPRINCRLRTYVRSVVPERDSVTVIFEVDGSTERARYDHVVNALWDGRLTVDDSAGLRPARPWLYRVKHYLRMQTPAATTLPSTTIMLGAFGDAVAYANGGLYLSWYPAGMRGSSVELSPPAWPLTLAEPTANEVRQAICRGLARIIPGVTQLPAEAINASLVKAGIIFAWGQTDIDDPRSELHERHAIGPRSYGRYHTVDTGKLTMAPLFGKIIADRIREIG